MINLLYYIYPALLAVFLNIDPGFYTSLSFLPHDSMVLSHLLKYG